MKKRLAGLKSIHVAPYEGGTFKTPVPITGAKSVSAELEYSEVKFYADDVNDFADYQFAGGSGELVLSGLKLEEYKTLFCTTISIIIWKKKTWYTRKNALCNI